MLIRILVTVIRLTVTQKFVKLKSEFGASSKGKENQCASKRIPMNQKASIKLIPDVKS
jgi:hypothetical protein